MIKKIFSIIFISTLILSCKKDEKITTRTTNAIPNSPYSNSNASIYSGIFASISFTNIANSTNILSARNSNGYFYNTPSANNMSGNMVKINELVLNGATMNFDPLYMDYKSNIASNLQTEVWQVNGANGIPSFNYTSSNNTPDCSNFNVIPDSISKSAGFTLIINGVVNLTTSGFDLVISDGAGSSLGEVTKPLHNGTNTVTFTPTELAPLTLSNNGFISIDLENVQVLNFYGKDFKFIKQRSFSKNIKIKA